MQNKKIIKKLVLNTSLIGNVILSGIIISGTYEPCPEIITLTAVTVASTSYLVKIKIREK
ncbi:MAG: hypothetical protein UE699_04965 [Bacilli bacterium]|nr:hypothetical protein [Mycoplasmatota bacterium]MDD6264084.1 hypothetical protein [bacterium]MDY2697308.1 hypothetical protein [Bacilli bacterium]MDD6941096.1 hypothetical protein [bacterium]MDY5992473.1 hypothetical protein [Bacilli bacterium]